MEFSHKELPSGFIQVNYIGGTINGQIDLIISLVKNNTFCGEITFERTTPLLLISGNTYAIKDDYTVVTNGQSIVDNNPKPDLHMFNITAKADTSTLSLVQSQLPIKIYGFKYNDIEYIPCRNNSGVYGLCFCYGTTYTFIPFDGFSGTSSILTHGGKILTHNGKILVRNT